MQYILVIDDDEAIRSVLKETLVAQGFAVLESIDGETGIKTFQENTVDLILLDFQMPDMDGFAVLKVIKEIDPKVPIIIFTGFGDIELAVEAIKLGAYDFITKPFGKNAILVSVARALQTRSLSRELSLLRDTAHRSIRSSIVPYESEAMKQVMGKVALVAPTDYTALLTGETGVGKDVLANMIHTMSKRKDKVFIPVDCGSIPETLIESELFGHEKGAFTGADKRKEGLFEIAEGGTLFLDEIGNLSLAAQGKLLRVIQERKVLRIGSKQIKEVNVRLIVATNMDLKDQIHGGKFREDLYYRLNEFSIHIPPLRDRKEDILPLANYFLEVTQGEVNKKTTFSDEAITILKNYLWPGNIRELKNSIRAAVLNSGKEILPKDFPFIYKTAPFHSDDSSINELTTQIVSQGIPLKNLTRQYEKQIIEKVLEKLNGDSKSAAHLLGLHYRTLLDKLR